MSQLKKRAILLSFVIVLSLFVFFFTPLISAQAPAISASLLFTPETVSINTGEVFTTQLWIDTDGAAVGGVGAKISFDPALLSVEKIETQSVFPDYPATTFDNIAGKIVISGIVNSKEELYTGKAQFATIHWKAKGSGDASIALDFIPNETSDSNIAVLYGNGDILQKVNAVAVNIVGTANTTGSDSTIDPSTKPVTYVDLENKRRDNLHYILLTSVVVLFAVVLFVGIWIYKKKRPAYKEEIPHIQTPQNAQNSPPTAVPPQQTLEKIPPQ